MGKVHGKIARIIDHAINDTVQEKSDEMGAAEFAINDDILIYPSSILISFYHPIPNRHKNSATSHIKLRARTSIFRNFRDQTIVD